MNNILIDTNIYSKALSGDLDVVSQLQRIPQIGISSVSIGELLSGFKNGRNEKKNRDELGEFLDSPRVTIYSINEETADFYAEVLFNLRKKGKPIPTNDIWIAASAFQYGLGLYTMDNHFREIPGLLLV